MIVVRIVGKQSRTLDNVSQLQSAGFFVVNPLKRLKPVTINSAQQSCLEQANNKKTSIITDPDLALAAHEEWVVSFQLF